MYKVVDNILEIEFTGKSFYRYMVRNLVGALIEVGKHKINSEYLENMLENYDTVINLPTSDACGLYLKQIKY